MIKINLMHIYLGKMHLYSHINNTKKAYINI